MAVAKNQIEEIYDVLWVHVFVPNSSDTRTEIATMLGKLSRTQVYERNKSFRDTVDRLVERNMRCNENPFA